MEIREKEVTATDLLNLAFIGTAIEPHLPRLREELKYPGKTVADLGGSRDALAGEWRRQK